MNVFEFRESLIQDYAAFSRSFVTPSAPDIKKYVDTQYAEELYWPSPYLQLNPSFVSGRSVSELVNEGILHPTCDEIFRIKRGTKEEKSLRLFRHQEQALLCAKANRSYVVTTGTGSGKSLTFFIPIIDAILREKENATQKRTKAIIIYPMNALANSQQEELDEFFNHFSEQQCPVSYGIYTGQESTDERRTMATNPPDILLTNFMMLELLMTRQNELDQKVMEHCIGLDYLVLDELHTYRGRQGADVAMLVRRVREALNKNVLCIGTSATMATEGSRFERESAVAAVASKLFGATVQASDVIGETLELKTAGEQFCTPDLLRKTLENGCPEIITAEELHVHPIACWIETRLGLKKEGEEWVRQKPQQIKTAISMLSRESGLDEQLCKSYLLKFLLLTYETRNYEGKSFFAYRLHQFISGAGTLFTTLESPDKRQCDLSGQVFLPGSDKTKRLFPTYFCRNCGQEFHPVWERSDENRFEPRSIDERSFDEDDDSYAFLMPDPNCVWKDAILENSIPEFWIDPDKPDEIKNHYRGELPSIIFVAPDGRMQADGLRCVVIRGTFKFCPSCGIVYDRGKDALKLPGLSGEGRSSATTIISLNALRYLMDENVSLDNKARKLLGFTDNRQDASLQAGHFNDFMQMLLLRSALLAAITQSPENYLRDDTIAHAVFHALRFHTDDLSIRAEYLQQPAVLHGVNRMRAEEAMRKVLGHRLYADLQRGWRYNSPNLEQLGLLYIEYEGLDDLCRDELWQNAHHRLQSALPEVRRRLLTIIFNDMRRKLCLQTSYLNELSKEQIKAQSANYLKEPWGIFDENDISSARVMLVGAKPKKLKADSLVEVLSIRSKAGTQLKSAFTWNDSSIKFTTEEFNRIVNDLIRVAFEQGYLNKVEIDKNINGYQLKSDLLLWKRRFPEDNKKYGDDRYAVSNPFFRSLYSSVADFLSQGSTLFHSIHAQEHTAQVDQDKRKEREKDFREGMLRILYCSPTMELGVNISTLNTVYMRNVPPTPANYAQRSGRAGRSGQPALVITYCAAQSPHDQYFFSDPVKMIHGEVTPPALDICNEELIAAHLNATWLATTRVALPATLNEMLDMQQPDTMPLLIEYANLLDNSQSKENAWKRCRVILDMIGNDELEHARGLWLDADKSIDEALNNWLSRHFQRVFRSFDDALKRWRDIYKATRRQMDETRKIIDNPAASEKERMAAKRRHDEAFNQQKILLESRPHQNSDFSTYRYLAGEGFLPGYNFPRLPVSAYIPAQTNKKYDSYLSRPRFLAISEFGPNSLIYHEGAQYRVRQVILSARNGGVSTDSRLPVEEIKKCSNCGYGHFGQQKADEFCVLCGNRMGNAININNLYRIENVSTRKANRITCDEEERMRQGYDVQTTVQFSKRDGKLNRRITIIEVDGIPVMELQYGPVATVRRMNLGWKRRKEKHIYGFNINTTTGFWCKDEQAPADDVTDDDFPNATIERITPYAEDRRNVLLIRPCVELDPQVLTTLQYALKRGIESLYQLEESELMAEPLPDRDNRKAILFYEAAEGGAGVLTRLATRPDSLGNVAREAIEIMHYSVPDKGADSPDDLIPKNASCEMGCYKCLLSYYNQPDHETIDRTNRQVLEILLKLMTAQVSVGTSAGNRESQFNELLTLVNSAQEKTWLRYLYKNGHLLPDSANAAINEFPCTPDFVYNDHQALVFIGKPEKVANLIDDQTIKQLEEYGYLVIIFPEEISRWPSVAAQFPEIFGCPLVSEEGAK